jgi:protoporphyrinogen oxidase
MNSSHPIRIIGGGMTGLTVGLRLAQRGYSVVVHEKDPYLGGLSGESTLNGIPIERYYHCVLPTDTRLRALFQEIGVEESLQWNRTRTGFFHDGKLIEMTTTGDFLKFPALNVIDRARLAWTIEYSGLNKRWERFDREPVSNFLRRHGGNRLFESIWEPLLLSKLGKDYDRFAASFIWATITRMLSARKHKDRSEKLGFIRGRYGRVFAGLRKAIEAAGGRVEAGYAVSAVSKGDGGKACWNVNVGNEVLPASGVVLCMPAPVAAEIVKGLPPAVAGKLQVEYLGVVCEVLLLKRSLTPYYVLNLTDRRLPFTGVVEFSNLAGCDEYNNRSVVYLPRYAAPDSPAWTMEDRQLHVENCAGLRLIAPDFGESDVVAWQVHRSQFVQPIHGVGRGGELPPIELAPGLAYLSTAQIHPWPVFNDVVVGHVDLNMSAVVKVLGI